MVHHLPQRVLALALAGAIAFGVANGETLLSLSAAGLDAQTTIIGGSTGLWREGYWLTAAAVFCCTVAAPAAFLLLLLAGRTGWAARVRDWAMPEVMLLALVVVFIKISSLASVSLGIGGYAAAASVLLFAGLGQTLDAVPRAPAGGGSSQRTWALIAAAAICYVPANLLPVLSSTTATSRQDDTILSGVVYLFTSGAWPLGLIVLVASVIIPIGKLAALGYLLLAGGRAAAQARADHARLLRLVEVIGRWSMLDVFVVAFIASLVQLEPVMSAHPGPGVPFFAAVVVLTMLAALSLDRRLLRVAEAARA